MLFKQQLIYKIVTGHKTQTRRIAPESDYYGEGENGARVVYTGKGGIRWVTGRSYAVQPKRGAAGMLYGHLPLSLKLPYEVDNNKPIRIRVTQIIRTDVRRISLEDAKAEGFEGPMAFLGLWAQMHDPRFVFWFDSRILDWCYYTNKRQLSQGTYNIVDQDTMLDVIKKRPADKYMAWALTFEVCR